MNRLWIGLLLVFVITLGYAFAFGAHHIDQYFNTVAETPAYLATPEATRLHERLLIADLHADTLLWPRDMLERADHGHVDVPRLIEGNVALQAFFVVTKMPRGINYDRNKGDSDLITPLVILQRWPTATWTSLTERALYQARKLHDVAARSGGRLVLIKSASDLERYLNRRQRDQNTVGGVLGIEGLHALEGKLSNLDVLYEAGFRIMGLTHFFDNEVGGSTHGVEKGGAKELGRRAVQRMEELKITLDLAHAAPALIDDVLEMATRPVVVSHTGVKETCQGPRNLSDDHVRRIAGTGGVIGIGFWDAAVCEIEPRSIARTMRYVANLVGVEHVALGSDFDGATHTHFDVAGLIQITDALRSEGFSGDQIRKIMGGNQIRLLAETLPAQ
jgi:microsomal dipeptidase-like Zn-dependent dipeptidase